jgi:biopolymer transport protein ExbB/TolQ
MKSAGVRIVICVFPTSNDAPSITILPHRLATIGSTAPFVGLLGTVIGIIDAFREIQGQNGTGISAVAGGISEALVTTALGLTVAIPAVVMFNYFTSKIKAFDVEMDNSSSELVDYFLKRAVTRR